MRQITLPWTAFDWGEGWKFTDGKMISRSTKKQNKKNKETKMVDNQLDVNSWEYVDWISKNRGMKY